MEVAFVCDWLIDPNIEEEQEEEGEEEEWEEEEEEGEEERKEEEEDEGEEEGEEEEEEKGRTGGRCLFLLGSGVAKPNLKWAWASEFKLIKIVALCHMYTCKMII